MKKIIIVIVMLFTITILSSCNNKAVEEDKLLTSIEPVKSMLSAIVKDKYKVYSVIPGNASPESYNPTIKNMQDMSDASIFFGVGVPAEDSNIIDKLSTNTNVVHLEDSVTSINLPNGARDPHIWLSIPRVKLMMNTMLKKVIEIDRDNETFYTNNLNDYFSRLDKASDEINEIFKDDTNLGFISYHPSLNYFAEDYGLDAYAIEKNGQEPSPKELVDVVDLAKEKGFKTIFFQSSVNSSEVETVANEIGAKMVEYDPLSSDYINNLIVIANLIEVSLNE